MDMKIGKHYVSLSGQKEGYDCQIVLRDRDTGADKSDLVAMALSALDSDYAKNRLEVEFGDNLRSEEYYPIIKSIQRVVRLYNSGLS